MPEEPEMDIREQHETVEEIRHGHEEAEHEGGNGWLRWISLSTAILAVIAAVASLQSGTLVNEALLEQSKAVQYQAQASDQWAYYQAAGIKANTAEQTSDLLAVIPAGAASTQKYKDQSVKYESKKEEITKQAKELEKKRDESEHESDHFMHSHHIFAYCVTFTQVAIALAAIAALTRRRPVWYGSLVLGAIGLGFMIKGFLG